jgi:hypothetical protein
LMLLPVESSRTIREEAASIRLASGLSNALLQR